MAERLRRRHPGKFRGRRVAERTPGGGEDQAPHLLPVARPEALVGSVMLAVHRHQQGAAVPHRLHHQLPARHQYFLVRQTDPFAHADGGVGRLQSRHSHDGRDQGVRFRRRGCLDPGCRSVSDLRPAGLGQARLGQPAVQLAGSLGRSRDHNLRMEFQNLAGQDLDVVAGHQGIHLKKVWVAPDDVQSVGSDGAR